MPDLSGIAVGWMALTHIPGRKEQDHSRCDSNFAGCKEASKRLSACEPTPWLRGCPCDSRYVLVVFQNEIKSCRSNVEHWSVRGAG